jgi:hypothetical protein
MQSRGGLRPRSAEFQSTSGSAWAFEREGTPPSREPERIAGPVRHVRHGEWVAAGERTGGLARAFLVLAIVLLILGLLVSLR